MLIDFRKARLVTGLMLDVVKLTENGRKPLHTYENEPIYNSLNVLADFAQAESVKRAPPTKTERNRGKAEEIHFSTTSQWTKKIRLRILRVLTEKKQRQLS